MTIFALVRKKRHFVARGHKSDLGAILVTLPVSQREIAFGIWKLANDELPEDKRDPNVDQTIEAMKKNTKRIWQERHISCVVNGWRLLSVKFAKKIGRVIGVDYRLLLNQPEYELDHSLMRQVIYDQFGDMLAKKSRRPL